MVGLFYFVVFIGLSYSKGFIISKSCAQYIIDKQNGALYYSLVV